jgi:hypothetical protein
MSALSKSLEQLHTAIVSTLPKQEVAALLQPNPRLTPAQLIGIYQEAYHLRLRAAVRADYPATQDYLGATCEELITAFVQSTPSYNYNLDLYSVAFADFISLHASPQAAALAALEAGLTEAFMFQDTPALSASTLAGMDEMALGATCFTLHQSVRLLHLTCDAEDYFAAFKASTKPRTIPVRETYLLLFRQHRAVQRMKICFSEFALLQSIKAGANFNAALTAAIERSGSESTILPHIGGWLSGWFMRDMIVAIDQH